MTDSDTKTTPGSKRAHWQRHIDQWRTSGLTQAEYCRRHSIAKHQWGYWRKRLSSDPHPAVLVPVSVPGSSSPGSPLRVIIDSRFRIEVHPGFDPATLIEVVACLSTPR
jgi:hypothetical protein